MSGPGIGKLGLLIRSAPMAGRSGRDQFDVALAAAVMGMELHLYFLGDGALHLLNDRKGAAAGLPATARAWKSLQELTRVDAWIESRQHAELQAIGSGFSLHVEPLDRAGMDATQTKCDLLMVL